VVLGLGPYINTQGLKISRMDEMLPCSQNECKRQQNIKGKG